MSHEPRCEKTCLRGFPLGSSKHRAVQPQKMVIGSKFRIYKVEEFTIYKATTKVLISFAVTAKLICDFVFAYAKGRISHDAAHMLQANFSYVNPLYRDRTSSCTYKLSLMQTPNQVSLVG